MFTFIINNDYIISTNKKLLYPTSIKKMLGKNPPEKGVHFGLFFKGKLVGFARLITDFVDVAFTVDYIIKERHKEVKIYGQRTIGEIFLKITMKYPPIIRNPEFRFGVSLLDKQLFINKFKFSNQKEHKIMIKTSFDSSCNTQEKLPEGLSIYKNLTSEHSIQLLDLLKNHAYWAENYTRERLELLTEHSECYSLLFKDKLIGFARVVTDYNEIASLWDVVIHENYRKKGYGKVLMQEVFSDSITNKVNFWLLYTDDAHELYKKFGFVSFDEVDDDRFLYKLRLQELFPSYSTSLKQRFFPLTKETTLDEEATEKFIYTKRNVLSEFWSDITEKEETKVKGATNIVGYTN